MFWMITAVLLGMVSAAEAGIRMVHTEADTVCPIVRTVESQSETVRVRIVVDRILIPESSPPHYMLSIRDSNFAEGNPPVDWGTKAKPISAFSIGDSAAAAGFTFERILVDYPHIYVESERDSARVWRDSLIVWEETIMKRVFFRNGEDEYYIYHVDVALPAKKWEPIHW